MTQLATEPKASDHKAVPASAPKVETGQYTGNPIVSLRIEGDNYKAEKYTDIGPLVIKTPRGEIKALAGDYIVYFDDPTDKEKPKFLHVIPSEIAEILGIGAPPDPPITRSGSDTAQGKEPQTNRK